MALEAPDPATLARFYTTLLEWPIVHEEPGTTVIKPPQDGVFMVFQQADGYTPPTWPPTPGAQRPMMHLDIQVDDFETAVADAIAAGARLAPHHPNPIVRGLRDPAGHPFCLCLDDGS